MSHVDAEDQRRSEQSVSGLVDAAFEKICGLEGEQYVVGVLKQCNIVPADYNMVTLEDLDRNPSLNAENSRNYSIDSEVLTDKLEERLQALELDHKWTVSSKPEGMIAAEGLSRSNAQDIVKLVRGIIERNCDLSACEDKNDKYARSDIAALELLSTLVAQIQERGRAV